MDDRERPDAPGSRDLPPREIAAAKIGTANRRIIDETQPCEILALLEHECATIAAFLKWAIALVDTRERLVFHATSSRKSSKLSADAQPGQDAGALAWRGSSKAIRFSFTFQQGLPTD
jgi:hypothetical protein